MGKQGKGKMLKKSVVFPFFSVCLFSPSVSSQNVILSEAKDLETAEILRFAQNDMYSSETTPSFDGSQQPRSTFRS
jgi:hypothetical protein